MQKQSKNWPGVQYPLKIEYQALFCEKLMAIALFKFKICILGKVKIKTCLASLFLEKRKEEGLFFKKLL